MITCPKLTAPKSSVGFRTRHYRYIWNCLRSWLLMKVSSIVVCSDSEVLCNDLVAYSNLTVLSAVQIRKMWLFGSSFCLCLQITRESTDSLWVRYVKPYNCHRNVVNMLIKSADNSRWSTLMISYCHMLSTGCLFPVQLWQSFFEDHFI